MRLGRTVKAVLGITVLLWMVCAYAQQIHFTDFSSVANLQLNGAHPKTWGPGRVLGLTDGSSGQGTPGAGTAWFAVRQPVKSGFTTYFKFQIHSAGICCLPGDGLAFVVQNSSVTVKGLGMGGLGYEGILNSLAVEFDTHKDPWDPNANHLAVQSCGVKANSPVHNGNGCLVVRSGINPSIPHLGVTCGSTQCVDGRIHQVVIEYTAPSSGVNSTLKVWIDPTFISGTHTPTSSSVPAIDIPYNIVNSPTNPKGISLAGGRSAYVGFTASQTEMPEAHDILAWEFTPHTFTQVQQTIPPGGTPATYSFGAHDTVVTYPLGFVNTQGILMTVKANPVPRDVFQQRLAPGPFNQEQCIVYQGTGGNCIVYSITCQLGSMPVTCPASSDTCIDGSNDPGCIVFSTGFFTTDPVICNLPSCGRSQTNADYLKADPIGSDNFVSIFLNYQPSASDGRTTGTGNTPSDFVATFTPNKE